MSETVDPEVAAREELARREEEADTKWLMGTEAGRRVVWELLEFAGVYRTSPTMDNWTFFHEGRRSVGLKLLDRVHTHCADEYALMTKEHRDE